MLAWHCSPAYSYELHKNKFLLLYYSKIQLDFATFINMQIVEIIYTPWLKGRFVSLHNFAEERHKYNGINCKSDFIAQHLLIYSPQPFRCWKEHLLFDKLWSFSSRVTEKIPATIH